MFPTLPAKLFHFFKRFFAVFSGFARRAADGATKVRDDKFCFGHKLLAKCSTKTIGSKSPRASV